MFTLLPKEDKFHVMLTELTTIAASSAEALDLLLKHDDRSTLTDASKKIGENKVIAKKISQDLNAEVCRTFITPFDREDLQALNTSLYFISKLINKVQLRVEAFNIINYQNDLTQFSTIIQRQTTALKELIATVNGKRNLNELYSITAVLHELEDQGDILLVQWTARSFKEIDDIKELFLRHDVYRLLEQVTNTYRDCANLAMQIVLKHS